ncbi:SSI family serine proteinase inhibitor [Streptomyces sp. NPDC057702]|uniref:SSI family serine proteinase inhibitor n=1 Tax=unclassified Streptomyces TaxID=2593676 RepID=UPI0036C259E8
MHRRARTARVLAIAWLALLAAAPSAGAAPQPTGSLFLTVSGESGTPVSVARLECEPAGGTHPRAAEACAALGTAGGDPDRLTARRLVCTEEHAPVTARVAGLWRGTPVTWSRTYPNSCHLHAATGALFAFPADRS